MSGNPEQQQKRECPVCGKEYDYRVRHAKESDWKVRNDVAVCSRTQNDERLVYIHYDVKPVTSVSKTVRKDKSSSLYQGLFGNS